MPTYRERKLAKVSCPECNKPVANRYLPTHLRHVHHMYEPQKVNVEHIPPELVSPRPHQRARTDPALGYSPVDPLSLFPPRSSTESHYEISFPSCRQSIACPVDDCMARAPSRAQLRRHFARRHPFDSICIAEEGLLPQCRCCGLRCSTLQPSHYSTDFCKRVTRQRLHWARALHQLEATNTKFFIGDDIIENVSEFKYLGRVLHNTDLDDAAVALNLRKARTCWNFIHRILRSDGCTPHVMAYFYKTIVQAVLLFGSETWVLSQRLRKRLDSFHLRCARQIAHRPIQQLATGEWEHPDSNEVLEICKMSPISAYIAKRKTKILQTYAVPHSELYKRCLSASSSASTNRLYWWKED